MNARILLLVAVLVAGVAVWYYQKQDSTPPPINISPSEVEYEATDIQAVQTNEQGETEYQLDAKSLSFNPETNQDELSEITMNWEPVKGQHYRIQAGKAVISQQTGDMQLSDGFILQGNANGTDVQGIVIKGQTLKGNSKQQLIYSDEPVSVEQDDNTFNAASMKADLQTGEYEFSQVAITYQPPVRQDKPLF